MPISIDEVVTEIAPQPAPVGDAAAPAATPAAPDSVAPDPVALAHLLAQLAWRAARVAAD